MTPLQLFRKGLDTMDIAKRLNRAEAEIVRLIDTERNEQRGQKWRLDGIGGSSALILEVRQ